MREADVTHCHSFTSKCLPLLQQHWYLGKSHVDRGLDKQAGCLRNVVVKNLHATDLSESTILNPLRQHRIEAATFTGRKTSKPSQASPRRAFAVARGNSTFQRNPGCRWKSLMPGTLTASKVRRCALGGGLLFLFTITKAGAETSVDTWPSAM